MRLLLVRHPQPIIETGICYGRSDLDVSAEQLTQARRQLALAQPTALTIYTSPLQRCAKLAQALAEHWNPCCTGSRRTSGGNRFRPMGIAALG